jgi:hypothetical protein
MTGLSNELLIFARAMSPRQWRVLETLADGVWSLSASERSDSELYALIRRGLAVCHVAAPATADRGLILPMWEATAAGRAMLKRRAAGKLA